MLKKGVLALIVLAGFFRIIQWLLGWSSFSKYWLNAATAGLLLAAFVGASIGPNRRSLRLSALDGVVIAFFFHGVFLTAYTAMSGRGLFTSLNGFRTYFFGCVVYFLFRMMVNDRMNARSVALVALAMLTVIGAELIMEFSVMNVFLKDWTVLPWIYQGTMMAFGDSPERVKVASKLTEDFLYRPLGLLGYVHYSAYAVGLGVLLSAPRVISPEALKGRGAYAAAFAVLVAALFLSTTRSVLFMVSLLLLIMASRVRPSISGLLLPSAVLLTGVALAAKLGVFTFIESFLSGEDAFYSSFGEGVFFNLPGTNVLDLLFGRGFEPGIYESFHFGDGEFSEYGFHFNQISDQVHIFYYMDRTGVLGGALFFLQAALGFRAAMLMANASKDGRHKALCTGLGYCCALFLVSSAHILHSDIVMQFFNYTILGVTGSLWQEAKGDAGQALM